ncbi:hypothetical protein [Thalassolituus sp.]|jgi:hypothetical protein|uniref:hypothetical protein n=1 Tax=Thalassolituus sp. TaxID=2030822 RepID=UPI0032D9236D
MTKKRVELLPSDALKKKNLGISISDTPDLARLGLLGTHLKLALGELARTVITSGGYLYYGGHLEPDGFTRFLVDELHRYGRRDRPLKVCLAENIHRGMSDDDIYEQKQIMGLFGEIFFISERGNKLGSKSTRDPQLDHQELDSATCLAGLRSYMSRCTTARIAIGGKIAGYTGSMPGILEEITRSIELKQPLYLAGGFGGMTIEIIRALRPEYAEWFPDRYDSNDMDSALLEGLKRLTEISAEKDWDGFANGLDEGENKLLAASYRPSEIATLVGKGMGKILVED